MPKPQSEDDKKHGDKLEPLIGRTGGAPAGKRGQSAGEDDESDDDATLQQDPEDIDDDEADDARDSH